MAGGSECRSSLPPVFIKMLEATVNVSLRGLTKFKQVLEDDFNGSGTGPVHKAFVQWGLRYRSAMQQRFVKFSKGGGDWPQLSYNTVMNRRGNRPGKRKKGKLKDVRIVNNRKTGKSRLEEVRGKAPKRKEKPIKKAMILRDTGLLLAALSPVFASRPGQLEQRIRFGIRVGYGGPGRHPNGGVSIADIASFHQLGGDYLPVRKVIDKPDRTVVSSMASDMEKALKQLGDDTING